MSVVYTNAETVAAILDYIDSSAIADGMREFAEVFGEPGYAFRCGGECSCGGNCGEDDDCFACGDKANLEEVHWS